MTTYGVVSESLRKVVGLLTEAGQQLHRPKECGALLIEVVAYVCWVCYIDGQAAERIAEIDESMRRRKIMSSGGQVVVVLLECRSTVVYGDEVRRGALMMIAAARR